MDATAYERVVPIASCGSRWEAELKRSLLDSEGYHVAVASDDAGGLHPELAFLSCAYRLMVPEGQADDARALLDAIEAQPHEPDLDLAPAHSSTSRGVWVFTAAAMLAVIGYRAWAVITS